MFDKITETAAFLQSKGFEGAELGIVLGTGLGKLLDRVEEQFTIDYHDIPHFPLSTVEFHAGRLIIGTLAGRRVILMQGRFHAYEGHSIENVSFPIRVMQQLGIKRLFLSGAAGAMNLDWRKGDLMMLSDHINLQPSNPLIGPNDERLGPRFLDMSAVYDAATRGHLRSAAKALDIPLHEGVYVSVPGPMLETAAEYRFLRSIGADAVGMSTVPEVIVARHGGMFVSAIVVLTDECDPDNLKPINIPELLTVASAAEDKLIGLLLHVIPAL
ncbi:MAG: purine-nucleoside phosphorylase [Flavobacteriales bacterium]|nr:purine-nucleoside phosphorylase [Flavobacteriales bacterium]